MRQQQYPHNSLARSAIASAIAIAIGSSITQVNAALPSGTLLYFEPGIPEVTGCTVGNYTGTSCTLGGTPYTVFEITDIGGSYFAIDTNGDGVLQGSEKTAISQFAPIQLGALQISSGQHTGTVDGTENPAIDNAWNFFANTGMHTLTSPVSVLDDMGSTQTLDFSGWGVNWADFGPGGLYPTIPMPGIATLVCTAACADGDTYTLDMPVHIQAAGFTSASYSLHLEGTIGPPGPLPPSISINVSGGAVQECDVPNGNEVPVSASVTTPEPDDIASITWFLDDNLVGEGEDVDIFVPLGTHNIKAILETTQSGTAESVTTIRIQDTVDPIINAAFVDTKTATSITEMTGNGNVKVRIAAEASDICDPQTAVSMTVGSPAHVDDILVINTSKKKPTLELSGTTVKDSIELKATATDASGNIDSETVSLTITP